ncbi:hypothetical protein BH11BAC5_BH11BAC5_26040 [soil metagenome]
MSEDLITHSFTEAVDKGTIKKIISIIRIILFLSFAATSPPEPCVLARDVAYYGAIFY